MEAPDRSGHFSIRQIISIFVFCIVCIALNLALGYAVNNINIIIYLDTIGTITAALIGGFLPGVLVGLVTNILLCAVDPVYIYFAVINVLIGFFVALFQRRGWLKKIWGIIGMIALLVFIGGVISSLIPWFMYDVKNASDPLATVIYRTGHFGKLTSQILSNVIVNIPDKSICLLLSMWIMNIIPKKYREYLNFEKCRHLGSEEYSGEDRLVTGEKRHLSLKGKVLLIFGFSITSMSVVASGIGLSVYRKTIIGEYERVAEGAADIASRAINGDLVDEFLESGGTGDDYYRTRQLLYNILISSVDIEYLYVYKIDEEGSHVVFDLDTKSTPAEKTGSVRATDEGFKDQMPELLAGKPVKSVITDDIYGKLLTAYHPVYASDGNCACYVGVDVDVEPVDRMLQSTIMEVSSVYLAFFILLCVITVCATDIHIIHPINVISGAVEKYSSAENDQEALDENLTYIRSLDISTHDEVQRLYEAVCGMVSNQAEQLRSIRRLSESTAKMQDGLIITMADMVENRDSDTGDHVQKTAAYVKIIVEGLKKNGYYAEKLTPKFMSDVVRSAPLHDVGKINISDKILNKPGKLTDEEYEVMKTHTTAGKRIMERAISTVGGDNYLKEARNMAAYHHERWDGKGYPEGLHGEVIPLSARIMAVADVFDALTSARVYKPPFSFEEAVSMLEEGKGTQFDPKCVEVFIDSLDEVKVIFRKYSQNP